MSNGASRKSTEPEPAPTVASPDAAGSQTSARQKWVAPKLTFVEPKLTKHGPLTEVTGAFFGGFSPGTAT
jgi:hypothetical protein